MYTYEASGSGNKPGNVSSLFGYLCSTTSQRCGDDTHSVEDESGKDVEQHVLQHLPHLTVINKRSKIFDSPLRHSQLLSAVNSEVQRPRLELLQPVKLRHVKEHPTRLPVTDDQVRLPDTQHVSVLRCQTGLQNLFYRLSFRKGHQRPALIGVSPLPNRHMLRLAELVAHVLDAFGRRCNGSLHNGLRNGAYPQISAICVVLITK